MRVLRLCSVFEAPDDSLSGSPDLDPVGGMQIHTARLTSGLDALGVEQLVVTAYRRRAPREERIGERSSVVRVGVPIRRFRQLYGVAALPPVARLRPIDLVHVHLGDDVAAPALATWTSARTGVPLVATVHCRLGSGSIGRDVRSTLIDRVGGRAQDAVFARAAAILCVSGRAADELVASGIPEARVRAVPLGIDPPPAPPPPLGRRRAIVFVGRLVRDKGVLDLLDAFGRLAIDDAELVVVGDGPLRSRLEAVARTLRPARRVRFVGAVPHADVGRHLRDARVVVVPSWREERGRVVLEAMANGAPVVAARTGGIPESVADGVNGLLVPVRDQRALAAAIDRVLRDDRLAASFAGAGLRAAAGHSIDRLADATLDAYTRALRGPVSAALGEPAPA